MNRKVLGIVLLLASFFGKSQTDTNKPQMADELRQNGKIYVVISVIGIIFLALVSFLVYIERRVKKLEDKTNKN